MSPGVLKRSTILIKFIFIFRGLLEIHLLSRGYYEGVRFKSSYGYFKALISFKNFKS